MSPARALLGISMIVFSPVAVAACGPDAPAPAAPTAPPEGSAIGKLPLFQANGAKRSCEAPREDCPSDEVDRDFFDHCKLEGFQMLRCGCDWLCTGDVSASWQVFDPEGKSRRCLPANAECAPPAATAAFQDACSERGHKLVQCGCEWACAGNPTK